MSMRRKERCSLLAEPTVSPTVRKSMRCVTCFSTDVICIPGSTGWVIGLHVLRNLPLLKLILLDGVVQIMTDAALLKRQKKEIEELRNKLQVR